MSDDGYFDIVAHSIDEKGKAIVVVVNYPNGLTLSQCISSVAFFYGVEFEDVKVEQL